VPATFAQRAGKAIQRAMIERRCGLPEADNVRATVRRFDLRSAPDTFSMSGLASANFRANLR
jgi:hypothetical protein